MDLEKYIVEKFCEFKFPLVDKTEKEVDKFKSRLNARGVLHSGQFVSGSYEIRLKSKRKMAYKYLDLEIELRREKGIKFDEEIFIKIENEIRKFIEHEFENLISKTKEEANIIKFGVDNFENKFKPEIIRDRDSLISDLKRKLEMKKSELTVNESESRAIKEEKVSIRKSIRCFITGSDKCTKDILEKENQIFLAYDYKNEKLDKMIESVVIPRIKESGLIPIRAKDKIVNYDFMCKICKQIQESRYLLADISEDNLNVGLELGIAIGLQKTTMIMTNEKSKEIGDLKRTDSIRYNFENVDKLKSDFSNMIRNVI